MKPLQSRGRVKTQRILRNLNQEILFTIDKVFQAGGSFLDRQIINNSFVMLTFVFGQKKDLDGFVYLYPKWDYDIEGNYLYIYINRE